MLPPKYEDKLMTDRSNSQILNETIEHHPELIKMWFILCKIGEKKVKPEKRSNVTVLEYLDSYYDDLIKEGKEPDIVIPEEIKQEGWEKFYKNLEEKYAFNDPEYIVLETSIKKIDGVDVSIKKVYNESENETIYEYHVEGTIYAILHHSDNSLTLELRFPSEHLNGFNEKLFRDGIQLVSKNHLVNEIIVYLSPNATGFTNSSQYQKYIKEGLLDSQAAFSIKAGQIAKEEGFTATPEVFDTTIITGEIEITYFRIF
jgi:hypothetical protein